MLTFIQPKQKARSIQPTQQCKWRQTIQEKEKKKIQDFDFSGLLVHWLCFFLMAGIIQPGGWDQCLRHEDGHMWYDQSDLSKKKKKKYIYIYIYN